MASLCSFVTNRPSLEWPMSNSSGLRTDRQLAQTQSQNGSHRLLLILKVFGGKPTLERGVWVTSPQAQTVATTRSASSPRSSPGMVTLKLRFIGTKSNDISLVSPDPPCPSRV